ncbi:hypothetical protein ACHQM5_023905 [Ranunculus cassubicifolius]
MNMNISLVLTALIFISSIFINGVHAAGGIWVPISDPSTPEVQKVGEFAVSEHNKKANTALAFYTVVNGQKQESASGVDYWLLITTVNEEYHDVIVFKDQKQKLFLQSFKTKE